MQYQEEAERERPTIIVSANTFWNIANFRSALIKGLVQAGYRPVIVAPDVDADWAEQVGAEAVDIRIDRSGLGPLRDAKTLFDYSRLYRRFRPAAFLGFTVKPNIYGSLAARIAGVPALPNISGLGTAFIQGGMLSRLVTSLYRLALARTKIVFFQNPDDRDLFVARGIMSARQGRLLPGSGIDLERFASAPQPQDGPPVFLMVGRLLGDKGVREFADAARLLKRKHADWRFQLLGPRDDGNRTAIASGDVAGWVSEGVIDYLGAVDDVRPHISSCSALVLPSYREGLPRSLLEGAAMARPLVATDVPGNRHLVDDGRNGILCEVRNVASLAGAMEQVGLMSAQQRAEMGRVGRAKVEREFDERLVVQAYLDAIRQLQRPAKG